MHPRPVADPCGYGVWVAVGAVSVHDPPRPADVETATGRAGVVLDGKRGLAGQAHVVPILALRESGHLLRPIEYTHSNHKPILARPGHKIG